MSVFTNKKEADEVVITNLVKIIRSLKMAIVKTTDGKYFKVNPEEELTQDQVTNEIAHKQHELLALEAIAPGVEQNQNQVPQNNDGLLPEAQPADQSQAPAEQAQPSDQAQAPAVQSQTAEAIAADPATSANADPSQAQAQPGDITIQ